MWSLSFLPKVGDWVGESDLVSESGKSFNSQFLSSWSGILLVFAYEQAPIL